MKTKQTANFTTECTRNLCKKSLIKSMIWKPWIRLVFDSVLKAQLIKKNNKMFWSILKKKFNFIENHLLNIINIKMILLTTRRCTIPRKTPNYVKMLDKRWLTCCVNKNFITKTTKGLSENCQIIFHTRVWGCYKQYLQFLQ